MRLIHFLQHLEALISAFHICVLCMCMVQVGVWVCAMSAGLKTRAGHTLPHSLQPPSGGVLGVYSCLASIVGAVDSN